SKVVAAENLRNVPQSFEGVVERIGQHVPVRRQAHRECHWIDGKQGYKTEGRQNREVRVPLQTPPGPGGRPAQAERSQPLTRHSPGQRRPARRYRRRSAFHLEARLFPVRRYV